MRSSLVACALICAAMLVNVAPLGAATLYDANADFSIAANPNSPWTYGYYDSAATVFTPYSASTTSWHGNANLDAWSQFLYDSASYSVVGKNMAGTIQGEGGSIAIDPGYLFTHPGANGEKGTIRWTATEAGSIDITATFTAADIAGGNRDVHVYLNGTEIYGAVLNGAKPNSVSAGGLLTDISVLPGTTIEWAVGFGSGGYSNDATMLLAELSFTPPPAPEPNSILLLGMGTLGLIASRRCKTSS